jgi:Flp pilus assembly protein TadB
MILAKYLFVAAFFTISILFFYSLIRIFFDHRRWIDDYFKKKRRLTILEQNFSQLLLQLSSFLKAGHALPQALKIISKTETGGLLSESLLPTNQIPRAFALGMTNDQIPRCARDDLLRDNLLRDDLLLGMTNDKLKFFILFLKQAMMLSTRNGIPLSPILEQISKLYQTEIRLREKIALLTFPAKTQALIAVLLPWFILVIFGLIAPDLITGTLKQTAGVVGFSTALVIDGIALKWIQKIIHS